MADDDDLMSLDFTSFVPPPEPAAEEEVVAPPAEIPGAPAEPVAPAYKVPALPAALREAADLYARGQEIEACRRLELAIKGEALGEAELRVWQALFELLETLGRRQAFETLALVYAKRFELSPPAWAAPVEPADHVNASAGGRAHVALNGTLDARVGEALKEMLRLAQTSPLVRIDVARLGDADNDGATLLLRALAALKKARREYLFANPAHLARLLADKLEPGQRHDEAMWLLLLEMHQQSWDQLAFEEAAVNYAVTFEVSPPSYVLPTPGKTPVAADVSGVPSAETGIALSGQMLGAGPGEFAALRAAIAAAGEEPIEINALALVRCDAGSAAELLAVLEAAAAGGRRVRISGLSQLVAAYLIDHGVAACAELRTRKN